MRPAEDIKIIKQKAEQNFQAAILCSDNKLYNSAISRMYYSILQKLIVILMKKDDYDPDADLADSHNEIKKKICSVIAQQNISYGQLVSDFDTIRRNRKSADYKTVYFDSDDEYTDCLDINNKVDFHFKELLKV